MRNIRLLLILLSMFIFSCETDRLDFKTMLSLEEIYNTPRDFKGIKIFAHRGHKNAKGSYENTLTSIIKAAEIGVHGVELDVRLSADEVLYLHHDPKVKDGRLLGEMNSSEIDKVVLPNGDKIPRVSEVLNLLENHPKILVNLEIKQDVPSGFQYLTVRKINDLVMSYNMAERVFFSSFNIRILTWSKEYNSSIKTQLIAPELVDFEEVMDAEVDMISFYMHLLREDSSLIPTANSYDIDICSGGNLISIIEVLDNGWNIKYMNTGEPDKIMELYLDTETE